MLTEENNFSTLSVPVVKIYPGFEVLDEKTYLSVMYYLVKNLIKLLTHLPVDKRATKISPVSTVTTIWWLFCLYFKIASMLWDLAYRYLSRGKFWEICYKLTAPFFHIVKLLVAFQLKSMCLECLMYLFFLKNIK